MSKESLPSEQEVTEAALVDSCAEWARRMTHTEARGPGDLENAWHRLEARYGVPWRLFWQLRYRKPKVIAAALYLRLLAAYQHECERQTRKLRDEIEITKNKIGADHAAVRAAAALVGEDDSEKGQVNVRSNRGEPV